MKARQRPANDRTRPHWWPVLLSLFVALFLTMPVSQFCALVPSAPGHSAAPDDSQRASVQQKANASALQAVPEEVCCSSRNAPPVVRAAFSRSATPDEHSTGHSLTAATLPLPQRLFLPANCYGRAGPARAQPLRSQFSATSLLGRAPPVSV